MLTDDWYQKPTKEISINQEVYSICLDCIVKIKNIRVDSLGSPLFTLEDSRKELFVSRFCEILEIK